MRSGGWKPPSLTVERGCGPRLLGQRVSGGLNPGSEGGGAGGPDYWV